MSQSDITYSVSCFSVSFPLVLSVLLVVVEEEALSLLVERPKLKMLPNTPVPVEGLADEAVHA